MALDVLGWCHRRGELHLTLALPDGTRSLIPTAWTDLRAPPESAPEGTRAQAATLAHPCHLLQACTVVDALQRRREAGDTAQTTTLQERSHATAEPIGSTAAGRRGNGVDPARRGAAHRRRNEAGAPDGQDDHPDTKKEQR